VRSAPDIGQRISVTDRTLRSIEDANEECLRRIFPAQQLYRMGGQGGAEPPTFRFSGRHVAAVPLLTQKMSVVPLAVVHTASRRNALAWYPPQFSPRCGAINLAATDAEKELPLSDVLLEDRSSRAPAAHTSHPSLRSAVRRPGDHVDHAHRRIQIACAADRDVARRRIGYRVIPS
jgi:hypothetical protein